MVALNLFNEIGVFPPELVGKKLNCTEYLIDYLFQKNIKLEKVVSEM